MNIVMPTSIFNPAATRAIDQPPYFALPGDLTRIGIAKLRPVSKKLAHVVQDIWVSMVVRSGIKKIYLHEEFAVNMAALGDNADWQKRIVGL